MRIMLLLIILLIADFFIDIVIFLGIVIFMCDDRIGN